MTRTSRERGKLSAEYGRQRLRILLVQPFGHLGGHYASYTRRLALALAECNHDVVVLSSWGIPDLSGDLVKEEAVVASSWASSIVRRERPGRLSSRLATFLVALRALRLVRRDPKAIVHVVDFEPGSLWLAVRLSARSRNVLTLNAIYHVHELIGGRLPERLYRRYVWGWCVKAICRGMTTIVHADRIAELAAEAGIVSRATVIPWGVDSRKLAVTTPEARAEVGVPPRACVGLFFGSQRFGKGLDCLLEAAAKLPAGRVHLLIAGEPDDSRDYDPRRHAEELGIRTHCTFHMAFVPEDRIDLYFIAADFVALPYRRGFEAASGVLAIGSGYGLPTIACSYGDIGQTVVENEIGITCNPEDHEALGAALELFASLDEADRAALRSRVYAYAESRSWEWVAQRHVEAYREALGRPSVR